MWLRLFLKCLIFFIVLTASLADDSFSENDDNSTEILTRAKRQYYDGYGYGSYDVYGWQIGRIIGWIIGLLVFLLFLCVPCICCLGIWFAGWFGIRSLMSRKKNATNQSTSSRVRFMERDPAPPPPQPNPEIVHRTEYIEDRARYFERREASPSPPPPAGYYNRERDTRRY